MPNSESEIADQETSKQKLLGNLPYAPLLVECAFCSENIEVETHGQSHAELVKTMYKGGWRYLSSQKYQQEGIVCPDCVEGEDW